MKTTLLLILALIIIPGVYAQNIKLTQKPSANDIKVVRGDYTLHFKPADLASAITKVDSISKKDHSALIASIKDGKLNTDDKAFTDILQLGAGCYLISRGKVAITKGRKPLTVITAEESPEMHELDGTAMVSYAYSDGEEVVYVGRLDTRLKKAK